jgi:5-methylcytosine-specific restriction endonuclease McrA
MAISPTTEIDFIEELKLRRWARENYVPHPRRDRAWHPVIHDEMVRKDGDLRSEGSNTPVAAA